MVLGEPGLSAEALCSALGPGGDSYLVSLWFLEPRVNGSFKMCSSCQPLCRGLSFSAGPRQWLGCLGFWIFPAQPQGHLVSVLSSICGSRSEGG